MTAAGPNDLKPAAGPGLLHEPGLVDLQVNGYAGYDVNADDVDVDTVAGLTRALWAQGVTTYLPTVITASEEKICHVLSVIAAARRSDPLFAHTIPGVHVEGPAIAEEDGPRGAHDRRFLRDPDFGELVRWQRAGENLVRLVTLAPERPGAMNFIATATAHGILVSLGHCAPEPGQVRDAVRAGARLSTHLGNGSHRMLPRHPNHLWTQLAEDRLNALLIADGHHLPADTITAMIRAKTPSRCVLTSDSAALAGMPAGEYTTPVGGAVEVGDDGRLSLAGTDLLAGSGASLRHCLRWAQAHLPVGRDDLLAMATCNPAKLLGLAGRVGPHGDSVTLRGDRIEEVKVAETVVYRE